MPKSNLRFPASSSSSSSSSKPVNYGNWSSICLRNNWSTSTLTVNSRREPFGPSVADGDDDSCSENSADGTETGSFESVDDRQGHKNDEAGSPIPSFPSSPEMSPEDESTLFPMGTGGSRECRLSLMKPVPDPCDMHSVPESFTTLPTIPVRYEGTYMSIWPYIPEDANEESAGQHTIENSIRKELRPSRANLIEIAKNSTPRRYDGSDRRSGARAAPSRCLSATDNGGGDRTFHSHIAAMRTASLLGQSPTVNTLPSIEGIMGLYDIKVTTEIDVSFEEPAEIHTRPPQATDFPQPPQGYSRAPAQPITPKRTEPKLHQRTGKRHVLGALTRGKIAIGGPRDRLTEWSSKSGARSTSTKPANTASSRRWRPSMFSRSMWMQSPGSRKTRDGKRNRLRMRTHEVSSSSSSVRSKLPSSKERGKNSDSWAKRLGRIGRRRKTKTATSRVPQRSQLKPKKSKVRAKETAEEEKDIGTTARRGKRLKKKPLSLNEAVTEYWDRGLADLPYR